MGAKLPEKCSLEAFQDKKNANFAILKVKIVKIYILIAFFKCLVCKAVAQRGVTSAKGAYRTRKKKSRHQRAGARKTKLIKIAPIAPCGHSSNRNLRALRIT